VHPDQTSLGIHNIGFQGASWACFDASDAILAEIFLERRVGFKLGVCQKVAESEPRTVFGRDYERILSECPYPRKPEDPLVGIRRRRLIRIDDSVTLFFEQSRSVAAYPIQRIVSWPIVASVLQTNSKLTGVVGRQYPKNDDTLGIGHRL
jgi:hypothetical protein